MTEYIALWSSAYSTNSSGDEVAVWVYYDVETSNIIVEAYSWLGDIIRLV